MIRLITARRRLALVQEADALRERNRSLAARVAVMEQAGTAPAAAPIGSRAEYDATKQRWLAAMAATPVAEVLPPEPAIAPPGHGAACRNSYVTRLEARVRRLQRQLDDAMGYSPGDVALMDAGLTVLRPSDPA